MELELEKQKIITNSHKRDLDTKVHETTQQEREVLIRNESIQADCNKKLDEISKRMETLQKTLNQYEREYNEKADEAD